MKNLSKTFAFLSIFILSASLIIAGCNKNKGDDNNTGGSSSNNDKVELETLLTKRDIRSTFSIQSSISIDDTITSPPSQYSSLKDLLKFTWSLPDNSQYLFQNREISLNFATYDKKSSSELNSMWDSQTNGVYKDKNFESVSNIGQKARFGRIGKAGGNMYQLEVMTKDYIFYLGLQAIDAPQNNIGTFDDAWDKKYMIDKAGVLADTVIVRLNR